jgi:hypothetical protein
VCECRLVHIEYGSGTVSCGICGDYCGREYYVSQGKEIYGNTDHFCFECAVGFEKVYVGSFSKEDLPLLIGREFLGGQVIQDCISKRLKGGMVLCP